MVVGAGLAAEAAVTALAARLGPRHALAYVQTGGAPPTDLFYGTMTDAAAARFHERAGLDEPALLRSTNTTFSWGTRYHRWGHAERSWFQGFELPFEVLDGVELQHFLTRLGDVSLGRLMVTAHAAARGVFAHPPGPPGSPLRRAEYGYQVDPFALGAALSAARRQGTDHRRSAVSSVETEDGRVRALKLTSGERIEADLFVDATGPDGVVLSALGGPRPGKRSLILSSQHAPPDGLPPYRSVEGSPLGWTATANLRAGRMLLTAAHPDGADAERATGMRTGPVALGQRKDAWIGNCVGIGHSAAVLEPLTTAPLTLLYRDIQRLLDLVPLGAKMDVERREYDRRFGEDAVHTSIFQDAFFAGPDAPDTAYWREARTPTHAKLARKLTQFEGRGVLAAYDLEPFGREDWLILHEGMGRVPARYDRLTGRLDEDAVRAQLGKASRGMEEFVSTMPPHARYLDRFLAYLESKS